jgi:hypothetical protein
MPIPGNLLTTAMAVMPHKDSSQALEAALSLDIPFWPQLPRLSYYENMYVQASEHFPGILLDLEKQTLSFSMEKFVAEVEETLAHFEDPRYFDISHDYSTDTYLNGEIFASYAGSIKRFLDNGGVLAWGIVPTNIEPFEKESMDSLENLLEGAWDVLGTRGLDKDYIISRSLISPATCCLVNPDGEKTVEKAFKIVSRLSQKLREKYKLL